MLFYACVLASNAIGMRTIDNDAFTLCYSNGFVVFDCVCLHCCSFFFLLYVCIIWLYFLRNLFDQNDNCGLLHGLVIWFCLQICGGIVICLIRGQFFSLPIMFFLCVVFFCCNSFS